MRRRERSRSAPWRLTITGWLLRNRSATSWASLNEAGDMMWGFALATVGMGRTAAPANGSSDDSGGLGGWVGRARPADTTEGGSGSGSWIWTGAGRDGGVVVPTGRTAPWGVKVGPFEDDDPPGPGPA